MDTEKLRKNLHARGFELTCFASAEEAKAYLCEQIQDTDVGFGGSKTADALDLYHALQAHNTVHWHWYEGTAPEVFQAAAQAEVYISSVNAIAETGELVNIDGRGNRVAALSFAEGKRVFIVASTKKVCPDLNTAIERARTVAAPINVQKLPGKRPCAVTGSCMDCRSPARGCCVLQVLMFKPMGTKRFEVLLIDEDLGF